MKLLLILPSQVFHDVAYKAKDRKDLVAGIDEFLDQVTVLPPGEWDPSIRIEPPKNVPSQVSRSPSHPPPHPLPPPPGRAHTDFRFRLFIIVLDSLIKVYIGNCKEG